MSSLNLGDALLHKTDLQQLIAHSIEGLVIFSDFPTQKNAFKQNYPLQTKENGNEM
jgi:hypothetical protein